VHIYSTKRRFGSSFVCIVHEGLFADTPQLFQPATRGYSMLYVTAVSFDAVISIHFESGASIFRRSQMGFPKTKSSLLMRPFPSKL